jgi:hypothetical protein
MKIKTIAFIVSLAACLNTATARPSRNSRTDTAARLEYHLSWDGKSPLLNVTIAYTPASSDSTVFTFGIQNFGGQVDIFKILGQIKSGAGDRVKVMASEKKVVVYHTGGGLKKLSYTVDGQLNTNPARAVYNELFRPVVTPGSLYIMPLIFMLEPQKHPATSLSVQWDSAPKKIGYFMSAAPGAGPFKKQVIGIKAIDDFLMVMGDDLIVNTYKVHNIPYYSITSKKDTINNLKTELEPFFTRYFPGLRDFWKDDDALYYYVCMLPLKSAQKPLQGGFGWGPGFLMKYSGPIDDVKKQVLAHETSHNWIGLKMMIGQDSFDQQWFGEGFNDYVCALNLAKSGIYDHAKYIKYVNEENFAKHYTSPVKTAPNDSIAAKYWKDKLYEKLPYHRGFIYAFYLDNQIRLASGNKQCLRDILLDLFARSKEIKAANPDNNLKLSDFIDALSAFLPRAMVESDVDYYMIKGNPIDFKNVKLISDFKIDFDKDVPVLKLTDNGDLDNFLKW